MAIPYKSLLNIAYEKDSIARCYYYDIQLNIRHQQPFADDNTGPQAKYKKLQVLHGKSFPTAKEPTAKASQIALFNRVFDEYLEEVTSKLPGYAVAVIIDGRIAPLLECVMAVDSGGRYFYTD